MKIYLARAEGKPEIVREALLRKAFDQANKASAVCKQMRTMLEEGLVVKRPETLQDLLEMELRSCLLFGTFFGASGKLHEIESADAYFQQARSIAEKIEDEDELRIWIFKIDSGRGHVLLKANRVEEAINDCFDEQLRLASELESDERLAEAQLNLARAYHRLGDFKLARSTVMNCIDNIKVRCSEKEPCKEAEGLLRVIFEDMEFDKEAAQLSQELSSVADSLTKLFNILERLARISARLLKKSDAFNWYEQLVTLFEDGRLKPELQNKRKTCLERFTLLVVEMGEDWQKASYLVRKWLEALETDEEDPLARIKCLTVLAEIHRECQPGHAPNQEVLGLAKEALSLAQSHPTWQLRILSVLCLLTSPIDPVASEEYRSECLSLATALQAAEADKLPWTEYEDIEELSYFGDRKVSKTTKSLMGGDFQMRTKTTKSGAIANRRRRTAPNGIKKLAETRKRTNKVVASDFDASSGLSDFIVDDEGELVDPNRTKQPKDKRKRPNTAVLISSSDEGPEQLSQTMYHLAIGDSRDVSLVYEYDYEYEAENISPLNHDVNEEPNHEPSILLPGVDVGRDLTYCPRALHVRVEVAGQQLLVPCFDDDIAARKTIRWLLSEAANRYAQINERVPLVRALRLPDGVLLAPNDAVSSVLKDNQLVITELDGWQQRTFIQEYRYQCERLGSVTSAIVEAYLCEEPLSGEFHLLDLSGLDLDPADAGAFVATLKARFGDVPKIGLNLACTKGIPLANFRTEVKGKLVFLDVSFAILDEAALIECIEESLTVCLETLNLAFVPEMRIVKSVVELLTRNGPESQLRILHLSGDAWSSGLDLGALHFLMRLERLYLEAGDLETGPSLYALSSCIQKSASIRHLAVTLGDSLTSEDLAFIAGAIKGSCSLVSLDLGESTKRVYDALAAYLLDYQLQIQWSDPD